MSTLVNAFITNLLLHVITFLRRCEAGSFCGQQNDLYAHICVYLHNITNMFWTDGDEINTNSRHEQRYSSRNSFRQKHFIASRNDATI